MLRSRFFPITLIFLSLAPVTRPAAQATVVPLTLRELLDSVDATHPGVVRAAALERAVRGARTSARAIDNPVVSYDVENARFPGSKAPGMNREIMTTLMLPLESIYQRPARVRHADAQVDAAAFETGAVRRTVALDAAHAFYGVARSQVAVAASTELVQWLDSIVVYNRMRVEEGAAAEVDLIRATLERDRAAAEMSMRAADLARDRMTLAAFLGDPVSEPAARAVAPSPALIPLPDLFAGALRSNAPIAAVQEAAMVMSREEMTAALGRRPDVLAARERVAAGSAAVSVERSMILRELSATFGTKRSEGTTTLIAGVSLPVPLFGQNRGEIARASAERDALGAELVATERDARSEIAGALAAAQVLTARIRTLYNTGDSASSYLGRADEARRIVHGAYREGGAPLVQVIDAARAWGEARSAYYELLYAQHESVLALRTVMGLRPVDAETQAGTGGGARGASVDR